MADLMMVTKAAVSTWVAGKCIPDIEKLPKICELYAIPMEKLLYEHPTF